MLLVSCKTSAILNVISGLTTSFFQTFGSPYTDLSAVLINHTNFISGSTPALCFEGFSHLLLRPYVYYKADLS